MWDLWGKGPRVKQLVTSVLRASTANLRQRRCPPLSDLTASPCCSGSVQLNFGRWSKLRRAKRNARRHRPAGISTA